MPTADLKRAYPAPSTQASINRAIRAELVGGDDAINAHAAFSSLSHAWRSRGWTADLDAIEAGHRAATTIVAGMRAEIRRRYGMPPERQ